MYMHSVLGHTTVYLKNSGVPLVILFGGATGDSGRYSITNDTFVLDVNSSNWLKLGSNDVLQPLPRAAHAATAVGDKCMVVYGGATGGGGLSSPDLYCFTIEKPDVFLWSKVEVSPGPSPGTRYGHVMVYQKPNLIVFGGNNGPQCVDDVWIMSYDRSVKTWQRVIVSRPELRPCARVYHAADVCYQGTSICYF
jgi:protein phosphatase